MINWKEKLQNVFSALGQDPLDQAVEYMDIDSTFSERKEWVFCIDQAIIASENGDEAVVEIINSSNGYTVCCPIEARSYFTELGFIYLKAINKFNEI